jgi:hypothetical protein
VPRQPRSRSKTAIIPSGGRCSVFDHYCWWPGEVAAARAGEALARRVEEAGAAAREALARREMAMAGAVDEPVVGRGIAVADGPRRTERAGLP